jgi:MtfA peptidase
VFGLRERRRRKLRATPLPPAWEAILREEIALCARLPAGDQAELRGLVQVFLAEKRFEGCGGLALEDRMRVIVAAQACLLLLRREHRFYPQLQSVLLYPEGFVADEELEEVDGVVGVDDGERLGESWGQGALVLSWKDVVLDLRRPDDGFNVVLHEFAHQIDDEAGISEGTAPLEGEAGRRWAEVWEKEYAKHALAVDRGKRTFMDEYGADDPGEFFAVATEHFFEEPRELRAHHPQLYEQLKLFYRQDPAAWGRV